jgi:hypothetical protein
VKRLLGPSDIEDALKRLDKLTHDEAMMATAQVLKVAHAVDNKVTSIDGTVTGIDSKVIGIDDKATRIDDNVRNVNNNVGVVISGSKSPFSVSLGLF